jgi:hypothetical protein
MATSDCAALIPDVGSGRDRANYFLGQPGIGRVDVAPTERVVDRKRLFLRPELRMAGGVVDERPPCNARLVFGSDREARVDLHSWIARFVTKN